MTTKKNNADQEQSEPEQPSDDTAQLRFIGAPYHGTLAIGVESFDVKDGKVSVPERLIAAAQQAGFR